jgi:predicted ATPase
MYLHIAAEQAKRLSAHKEAVHHLQRALDILQSMPPGETRTRQELTMQASLGVALVATKGYGAPEVERAFSMAHQLCDQIGDNPQLFSVLYGLRTFYLVRGNFRQAHELSEQLLRMAHATEDTDLLIEAHQAMGTVMFYLGDFLKSRMHLEQCMSLYRIDRHRTHAIQYGQDPGVTCLSYLALVLWCLGFPDQGLQKNREALALAEQAAHPFSLALALNFSALFYHFYRDLEKGFLRAQEAVRLSHDNNYPFWLAMGESILGVLMVEKGQEEGLVRLQKGLATWRATGAELGRPEFLTLLGWGLGLFGKANEGLETIEQAIVEGNRSGDRFIESELLRLKGELLMMQNVSPDEIESCYRTSIEVANKQRARLFELRATVNLSRLLLQQGNREKAYKPLQKIVQKIDEGLDSPDLRDAMSLMEELKTG